MVLAVNRNEFLGHEAGGQPQPEPEKMRRQWMQVERAVGLVAVQVNRHADHGDVREEQSEKNNLPPSQAPGAMGQPLQ